MLQQKITNKGGIIYNNEIKKNDKIRTYIHCLSIQKIQMELTILMCLFSWIISIISIIRSDIVFVDVIAIITIICSLFTIVVAKKR